MSTYSRNASAHQRDMGFRDALRILPWPVTILVIALVMPTETSIHTGSLRLSPYRILLIFTLVPSLFRLFSNRVGAPHMIDYLMIGHCAWVQLAFIINEGAGQGLESGGIYIVESLGAYLVGRCWIRNRREFEAFCRLVFFMVAVMLLFTIPESLSGYHFIREAFRAVLGGAGLPYIEPRLGLARAFGSFDHPILYGTFCATTLAATYYVVCAARVGFKQLMIMSAVGLATFLSLSSGAFVAMGIQMLLVGWDRFTRGIAHRWMILGGLFATGWIFLSFLSNRSPIKVFISYMTFSAHSAYNRILIWQFGTKEVERHPFFGIGFADWQRPDWMHSSSMDNFWLVTAVRYGLPALILLLAAILLTMRRLGKLRNADDSLQRYRAAWIICILGIGIAGITVHFWNSLFGLFMFLLGTGVWMTNTPPRERRIQAPIRSARGLAK
jgi:hypothetical protein